MAYLQNKKSLLYFYCKQNKFTRKGSMIIQYDKMVGFWVVWYHLKSLKVELFRAKTKKECRKWVEKNE